MSLAEARDIDSFIDDLLVSCPLIRSIWLVADCADGRVHAARLYTWDVVAFADLLSLHRLRKARKLLRRDVRLRVIGAGNRLDSTWTQDDGGPGEAFASDWQGSNPGDGYFIESSGTGEAVKRTRRRAICVWHGIDPLRGPGS